MGKPTLYVGLEGPVLVPHKDIDPNLGASVAGYAKPFLHWATQHFKVRWLTDRPAGDAIYVAKKLDLPADAIPVMGFDTSKAEVISPTEDFYWVDAELIPHEVAWLAQHGHATRFISVDPAEGVTPEHKRALEKVINKAR